MKKLILVFIIILSGCMVGPNYQKPDVDMPSEFVEEKPSEELTLSLKDWWKTFNDPTLDSLIDIAIENNLNLKIAIEKIEETRAFYRIKKADLFPEVDATASAIRYGLSKNLIQTSFFPKTSYNIFQAGFDATWEVDLFGRLRREKEAAFYEMQSKQEDMRDVYIILLSEVSRNYVDLCAIKNIMDVLSEKIEYQKTILNLISDRNQVGIDSRIETEQEIAVLNEDVETLIFYNTLLKQTAFKLAVLLGKHPEEVQDVVLKSTKIVDAVNKIKLGLPSEILRRRPDIKSAERRLAQSTAKVGAAIARFFPSFSLTGNTDLQVNKLNKFFSSNSFSWSLGSLMNWPIITFGRIRADVDMRKSEEKQALLFYENTILEALKDVESSLVAYYNEGDKLKSIEAEVLAKKEIATLEKNKYDTGLSNEIIYLENEKYYLEKRIKEIESKRTLANNLIALYKALGGGASEG